ncbi:amino acid racemase [Salmonella enterica subsp. enterica]|uniref:Amino acid racemase n=1 Tax=Salmonella enterica I TaxID=59201 RepID=A0A379W645_SALET|nr:amino acid racemase [Salmonella enterica subsp. enterica]
MYDLPVTQPCLSEIEDVVRYADISLNSEPVVLRALSQEAQRQGKTHQVLLMVDMAIYARVSGLVNINAFLRP